MKHSYLERMTWLGLALGIALMAAFSFGPSRANADSA
jgi:hypothetical protein